jgi:hypothetical protein
MLEENGCYSWDIVSKITAIEKRGILQQEGKDEVQLIKYVKEWLVKSSAWILILYGADA